VQLLARLKTVRQTVFEVSKSIKGLDEWARLTYVNIPLLPTRGRSEKENDTLCTKMVS
jgi:hypothetical protein